MIITGILAKRRGAPAEPITFRNAAAIVVSAGTRSYSDARVPLLALVASRQVRHRPRADISLVSLSAIRTSKQPSRADVALTVLSVARLAPVSLTTARAERAAVMVVHS